MDRPCFNCLPAYVWKDAARSQSFTDWFMLGRCFQNSSYSWKGHITFLLIPAVGELVVQSKRNLFFPRLFDSDACWLPCTADCWRRNIYLRRTKPTPGLYFSPMKECSVHGTVMEMQMSCLQPCHSHARNDRSGHSLTWTELMSWNQTTWNMADLIQKTLPCIYSHLAKKCP